MQPSIVILLVNFVSTLFMTGLIWFVQIVHYPLFNKVGEAEFRRYQNWHQKLTTLVVGPPMLAEAFSSVGLLYYPPPGISINWILAGVALIFVIWGSTAFLQVPCHGKLLDGFEVAPYRRLVVTNWLRTIAWTTRAGLVTWMVLNLMGQGMGSVALG